MNSTTLLGDAATSFLGDAGPFDVCAVNCTSAGNSACASGMTCFSFEPLTAASYCVIPCTVSDGGTDGGDGGAIGDAGALDGSCPTPTTCSAAGFCL